MYVLFIQTFSSSFKISLTSGIMRPHAIHSPNHIERIVADTNNKKLNLKLCQIIEIKFLGEYHAGEGKLFFCIMKIPSRRK